MVCPTGPSSLLTYHFAWCAQLVPIPLDCLPVVLLLHVSPLQLMSIFGAAGGASPPVCRLLNHSQVSFEAKVKERKLEKLKHENRRTALIKEVSCLHALCWAGRQHGQVYIAHVMHAGCGFTLPFELKLAVRVSATYEQFDSHAVCCGRCSLGPTLLSMTCK